MKKINPFLIEDDTPPTYETEVAKWWLIEEGERCSVWRWDSKKDETNKTYLLLDKDSNIIKDTHLLESVLWAMTAYDKATEVE